MTADSVRIFGSVPSAILQKMDADAEQKGVNRSEWLRDAIEAYLQNGNADGNSARSEELLQLRTENEQYRAMMKQSDQQIAFLQGHVSQLTQSITQLALPQMTEEEKEERKKHWWKFW